MDRAEQAGLGVAVLGHGALLAALSLGLFASQNELPQTVDAIEVQFVDATALRSAAPATEAPAPSVAAELGRPEETPPPEPTPAPPVPEPTPTPPVPQPTPRPAERTAEPQRPRLSANILKGLRDPRPSQATARGARLGDDFLKGIADTPAGRGRTPRAATVSQVAMNGLGAAIKRQVQPCYQLGALGGTSAMGIVTVLRLRFNRDGSVAGTPQLVEQTGVTSANRSYARQMEDVSRRAVLRCAPLKLPAELYEGGWEDIDLGFIPSQMD